MLTDTANSNNHLSFSLTKQQEIYQKILVKEFIREFNFLADVAAKRAKAKGDFTDKISGLMTGALSQAFAYIPIPVLSEVATKLTEVAVKEFNNSRKRSDQEWISDQNDMVDEEALRIVLERVAVEAARRYEYIIAVKLLENPLEGVIPFAKVGVERMLEYVARNNVALTEENLLRGLIEGRSGGGISGFTNTKLKGKNPQDTKLTAEGIYGRSVFRSQESKAYFGLEEKKAKAIWEKKLKEEIRHPDNKNIVQRLEEELKGAKESLYTHPYSKLKKTGEPKYGYVELPKEVIQYYSFDSIPSSAWERSLQHKPRTKTVGRSEVLKYIEVIKSGRTIRFVEYMNELFPGTELIRCMADLQGLDLRGTNWTRCDLSGTNFSKAQLQNSCFIGAHLVGANFESVDAMGADFSHAHLEYSFATSANFSQVNFTHARLDYAKLPAANLKGIQHLGSSWRYANLEQAQMGEAIPLTTEVKSNASSSPIEENKQTFLLEQTLQKFREASNGWDTRLKVQGESVEGFLVQLKQEQQLRETLARYCEGEFKQLQQQVTLLKVDTQQPALSELEKQLSLLKKEQEALPELLTKVNNLMQKINNKEIKEQKVKEKIKELEQASEKMTKAQLKVLMEHQRQFEALQNKLEKALELVRGQSAGTFIDQVKAKGDITIVETSGKNVVVKRSEMIDLTIVTVSPEASKAHIDATANLVAATKRTYIKEEKQPLTWSVESKVANNHKGVSSFNQESAPLIQRLKQQALSFNLDRHEKEPLCFYITIDSDLISFDKAQPFFAEIKALLQRHFGIYLQGVEVETDDIFHSLKLTTHGKAYADKLEGLLSQISLFAFDVSPGTPKKTEAISMRKPHW